MGSGSELIITPQRGLFKASKMGLFLKAHLPSLLFKKVFHKTTSKL